VVQVTVGWGCELKGSKANIIKSLVIKGKALVGVLYKLMDGKSCVIWLDNGIRYLRRRNYGEGRHNSVGVFLTDLGDKKGSHTGSCTTTHGVGHLEALKAVARLSLLTNYVKNRVDKLSSLGVVTLGPVVTSSGLAENEVIRAEKLTERSSTDGVHGTGLKIHKDGTGNISATSGLIEIYRNALQLKVGVTMVSSGGIDTVFIGNDFPELGTDLVAALATLNVDELAHDG